MKIKYLRSHENKNKNEIIIWSDATCIKHMPHWMLHV